MKSSAAAQPALMIPPSVRRFASQSQPSSSSFLHFNSLPPLSRQKPLAPAVTAAAASDKGTISSVRPSVRPSFICCNEWHGTDPLGSLCLHAHGSVARSVSSSHFPQVGLFDPFPSGSVSPSPATAAVAAEGGSGDADLVNFGSSAAITSPDAATAKSSTRPTKTTTTTAPDRHFPSALLPPSFRRSLSLVRPPTSTFNPFPTPCFLSSSDVLPLPSNCFLHSTPLLFSPLQWC